MRESIAAPSKNWLSATPEDTEALGAKLAEAIIASRLADRPPQADASDGASDALIVVYLTGDLGVGKTTFARGFLRDIGITVPVRSPTYTLLETYEAVAFNVVHLDLYRLRDPDELEPLGLRDLAQPSYVWLIEWAERGAGWLPPPDLDVRLAVESEGHRIEVRGVSAFGAACSSRITA